MSEYQEWKSGRRVVKRGREDYMKKRSIGILLLGLVICTCISGCSSQSIADVNEKSIQA